jgi:hypothetical protein
MVVLRLFEGRPCSSGTRLVTPRRTSGCEDSRFTLIGFLFGIAYGAV